MTVKVFDVRYLNNEGDSRWTEVEVGNDEDEDDAMLKALDEDRYGRIHTLIRATQVISDE